MMQHVAKQLLVEAPNWGLQTKIETDLFEARQMICCDHPNIVLLDLSIDNNSEDALNLLAELSKRTQPVPTLVLTAQDNLTDHRISLLEFLQKFLTQQTYFDAATLARFARVNHDQLWETEVRRLRQLLLMHYSFTTPPIGE